MDMMDRQYSQLYWNSDCQCTIDNNATHVDHANDSPRKENITLYPNTRAAEN